ncbi:MAG: NAD(P)-binding domain-containing protein [Rhizomicrobium sp.]|nr:NAD(P)-binding domain-containing protein [Rhizomicrobium sp.]
MQIAIMGAGAVGGALGSSWSRVGHTIRYGVENPSNPKYLAIAARSGNAIVTTVATAAKDAAVIVLAVPFEAAETVLSQCGDLAGRVVIDATNPLRLGSEGLALTMGFATSAAECVAQFAKDAAVFKTLNQVGAAVMGRAQELPSPPVMFVAGDNVAGKTMVMTLVEELGFFPIDAGGLSAARLLEPLAMLWIDLVHNKKTMPQGAFHFMPLNP